MVVVSSHNEEHCVGASWWVCVSSSALSLPVLGFLLEQQPLQGGDSIACVYSIAAPMTGAAGHRMVAPQDLWNKDVNG